MLALSPLIVLAQPSSGYLTQSQGLLDGVLNTITLLIGIAIVLAFLFFVWGIAEFIRKADDAGNRAEGRQRMIWGIVALAVLATVWGIVRWLQIELGLSANEAAPGIFQFFQLWSGN